MKKETKKAKYFDPTQSILRAGVARKTAPQWKLIAEGNEYTWTSKLERVNLIRKGISYAAVDTISKRIDIPIKDVLHILGLPQTTYNKRRREKSLLNGRDSETVLLLTELIDFGVDVFNTEEDKFQRWMKKPNFSLGGYAPESLLDSITGIQEVKNSLSRIEFGNLA